MEGGAARKARRAAEKRCEDEDAVSAAGKKAAADARAAVEQFEVDVGLPRAAAPVAAEAPAPEPERERSTREEENEAIERRAANFMARGEVAASKEAALCIEAAIKLEGLWRDVYDREEEWQEEKMAAAEGVHTASGAVRSATSSMRYGSVYRSVALDLMWICG